MKMWDVKGGSAVATLHGHKGSLSTAAWNDNGNWLLTAARDATCKVGLLLQRILSPRLSAAACCQPQLDVSRSLPCHQGVLLSVWTPDNGKLACQLCVAARYML